MDTHSLIPLIKTNDFYKDIANHVEKRFGTSNFDEKKKKKTITCRKQKKN